MTYFRPTPPLTPEEREKYLTPPPPKLPWLVVCCRNLAWRCPRLHRDGITTILREDAHSVLIVRDERSVLMTATDDGWISTPENDELRLPLDSTVRLEKRLHAWLTRPDN